MALGSFVRITVLTVLTVNSFGVGLLGGGRLFSGGVTGTLTRGDLGRSSGIFRDLHIGVRVQ